MDEAELNVRLKIALEVISKMPRLDAHRPEEVCALIDAIAKTVMGAMVVHRQPVIREVK